MDLVDARIGRKFGLPGTFDFAVITAWGLEDTLPRRFSQAGSRTAFLTTGPLSFAGIGSWLAEIGFAEVEGGGSEKYSDWPKVQFGAAPDEALYERSLEWIAERPAGQP